MSTDVATTKAQLPAVADMQRDSMVGRENMGIQDLALPYLSVLQALSPQVNRAHAKFIKDAVAGDFFNTISEELYDGATGVVLVPCAYKRTNVEWMPRDSGGGYVAEHPNDDILAKCKRDDRGFDILPSGNMVIPTAYYFCLLVEDGEKSWEPVVMSLSRTQLKKSRRWNSVINSVMIDDGHGGKFNPPMFSHKYKVTTIGETKKDYSWFGLKFEPAGMIQNGDLYQFARKLAIDVSKGLVKVKPPAEDDLDTDPVPGAKKDLPGDDDIPF